MTKTSITQVAIGCGLAAISMIGLARLNMLQSERPSESSLHAKVGGGRQALATSNILTGLPDGGKGLPPSIDSRKKVQLEDIQLSGSSDHLMSFEMGEYQEFIAADGKLHITVFGANAATPPGTPDVPVVSYVVDGVDGQRAEAFVLSVDQEVHSVEDVALRPAPPSHEQMLLLQEDDWYPKEVVDVQEAKQGGKSWVRVAYHPVQYNPVQKKVRMNRNVNARIKFSPVDLAAAGSDSVSVVSLSSVQASGLSNAPVCVPVAGELLPPMNGNPGDFASRQAGSEVQANWKFPIAEAGVYRITQPVLVSSGMDSNLMVGADFRLFCRSNEVAVSVSTDGAFGPTDYIEFFAVPHDGFYTTSNVYWLGFGGGGKRVVSRDVTPQLSGLVTTSHYDRVSISSNLSYQSAYEPNRDFDHWIYDFIIEGAFKTYSYQTPNRLLNNNANLSYDYHVETSGGSTAGNKDTRFIFGATTVTQVVVAGQPQVTGSVDFTSGLLTDGVSVLTVQQVSTGGILKRSLLDSISITYPRLIRVVSDQLCFALPPGTNDVLVDGFSVSNGTHILDITDAWCPVVLTNIQRGTAAEGIGLQFDDERMEDRGYYTYTDSTILNVTDLEEVCFRNLANMNRSAEYILICPYEFREQGYRLLKHRVQGDLDVVVAPIEDVINEFGYGVYDPQAVRQFLGYAWHHWAGPKPTYCLLAGDGSADPFDVRGSGVPEIIPVPLGPTTFRWTAQDNQYGMVNGNDILPDIAIGRIPVSSISDFQAVVDKTIFREMDSTNGLWRNQLVFVADKTTNTLQFKSDMQDTVLTNAVLGGYNPVFDINELYRDDLSAVSINTQLKNLINGGVDFITYMGHGSETFWTADPVFDLADIASLNNTNYPVLAIFSCENGAFQDPVSAPICFTESFLTAPGKGISACFSTPMLSDQIEAAKLADGFTSSLLIDKDRRLGDAALDGFLHLWGTNPFADALLTYEIFGDPALVVHP